jgi:hypothetical protein
MPEGRCPLRIDVNGQYRYCEGHFDHDGPHYFPAVDPWS